MASYCQKSQRYTKIGIFEDWFVTPDAFTGPDCKVNYEKVMTTLQYLYIDALESGIKPEDARYLLPEATKTDITCTFNCRSLFNFLDLRTDTHAQWEIRDLANALIAEIEAISPQWATLIDLWRAEHGS